jgi:hypothetical protein
MGNICNNKNHKITYMGITFLKVIIETFITARLIKMCNLRFLHFSVSFISVERV